MDNSKDNPDLENLKKDPNVKKIIEDLKKIELEKIDEKKQNKQIPDKKPDDHDQGEGR